MPCSGLMAVVPTNCSLLCAIYGKKLCYKGPKSPFPNRKTQWNQHFPVILTSSHCTNLTQVFRPPPPQFKATG